jgi:tRNA(fMet)-specific endonuclease VapC
MKYLLDTNVVSALMKEPSGKVADRLKAVDADDVCTSVIVVAEVKYGIWKSGSQRLAKQFAQIEPTLIVEPFSQPAEEHYARIRVETESVGLTVSQNDLLIAAQASASAAVLVTDDRIFLSVPGLKVENWLQPQSE